jgi:hypothetical protein
MGTITLPQDEKKNALEKKLAEYKRRLSKFDGVPLTNDSAVLQIDSVYKIAILKELFEKGRVDYDEMQTALREKYGFLNDRYEESFLVIEDYCKTGGKDNWGGTGFPLRNN